MNNLEKIIGHNFKDKNLLQMAFTHISYANENKIFSYERLEYLGDALLDFVVADYLYQNFNAMQAGELSKFRAKLVNSNILGDLVVSLGLDKFVLIGKSVQKISHSIYADIFESVLGAIYLDGGDYVKFVCDKLLINPQHCLQIIKEFEDYKTKLQEILQKTHTHYEYVVLNKNGADNNTTFEVALNVDGNQICVSTATSIKLAEQKCAKNALNMLSKKA